jgi:biopolymer transport protein ExbD
MNAAQVRAKARMAMKRREEEIEQEELEGGELNLVPYLDIVTNVMLFLLATVTSGLILGNINSALPEYSSSAGGGQNTEPQTPEEQPLQMAAFLTPEKITFFSVTGAEGAGSFEKPLLELPARKKAEDYEYAKLTQAAQGIVSTRWKGRMPMGVDPSTEEPKCFDQGGKAQAMTSCRPARATEVILVVDASIPYHVIIATMDALRQNTDPNVPFPDNVLFPDVIFGTGVK